MQVSSLMMTVQEGEDELKFVLSQLMDDNKQLSVRLLKFPFFSL